MDWGTVVVCLVLVMLVWEDAGRLSGMEDGGGSMLVVLVGKVDLGRGKDVLLGGNNAGLGMVRLTVDDDSRGGTAAVGLEMGFLTSLGSGLGWSGKICLDLFSSREFSEKTLEAPRDDDELVCDPDTFFGVGTTGLFILANTAESSWPLIALFKAAAFLVFTAEAAAGAGAGACLIVEALSVFAPR